MNYQEFIAHWRNELWSECMPRALPNVLKRAKEAAKNMRRAGNCTVAERDAAIAYLTNYCDRRKAELRKAA